MESIRLYLAALSFFVVGFSLPACAAYAPHYPQRIISLTPGTTEILYALGLGNRVVGDTNYCDYPPAAKLKPHVGDVATNYEAILALHPDLVIVDQIANARAVPRLQQLHLPLLLLQAKSLTDVEHNIARVGSATGTAQEASVVIHSMAVKEKQAQRYRNLHPADLPTLIIVGDNPLYVAGPDSFVGAMITEAGAKNIASGGFSAYSKEAAIAADPQVIFCEKDEAALLRTDTAWSGTLAMKRGNIFSIDPNIIYRPGPRLADGLLAIATDLAHAHQ